MSPPIFLAGLRGRGVSVVLEAGELKLRGSAQVLKPQVLEAARRYKPALLELLLLEAASTPEPQVLEAPASTCTWASPEHLQLAHEMGRIFSVFQHARLLRFGLWRLDAGDGLGPHSYNHANALLLCEHVTGCALSSFDVGAAYEASQDAGEREIWEPEPTSTCRRTP